MQKASPIIVITGPTASGKTKKAIVAAKKYDAEIICADSRVVYKGFDIASAKPSLVEQEGVVHHLVDIVEPAKLFSAGDFVDAASKVLNDIQSRGKNVIIAGGTWFYIKSLLDSEKLPAIAQNPALREELSKKDPQSLWKELEKLDPKRAKEVHANNVDKVIRSIEMCKYLNAPISQYKREKNTSCDILWFAIDTKREELYSKINARVDLMMENGLEEEFRNLVDKYGANKVISSTIGYKEFLEYGNIQDAVDKIKQHTRNFAKRQLSWLRGREDIKFIGLEEDI